MKYRRFNFTREANGDVTISGVARDAGGHAAGTVEETIPAREWCAIVASLSKTGKTAETTAGVRKLHER
jgi:hypothetical protein